MTRPERKWTCDAQGNWRQSTIRRTRKGEGWIEHTTPETAVTQKPERKELSK